ncbi:MAG: iron-containing alcohol dehydrogenase [Candidatus Methanomethylicia archaeon]|nr:iron-containing alcohol dehydrogenase [Candidatus Methanomethylicia archaeon]
MEVKPYSPLLKISTFHLPTRIVFGINSLGRLEEELKRLEFKKPLIIAGENVSKTMAYETVRGLLSRWGLQEYCSVKPEPGASDLDALAKIVRSEPPDLVVGMGGGSTMDMAKAASLLAANMGEPISFFRGSAKFEKGPPIVTLPTIAGTGSEVTPISVVVDGSNKLAIMNPYLSPALAVIDPALSLTAPPQAVASSGMDALCHAVESIMSLESNPISSALAFEAISLVDDHIERSYCNPADIEARQGLSLASLLAGMAFSATGLCLPHGIAYTYAIGHSAPHGTSVTLALPYVIEFNAPAIPEKIELIAAAMGIDTSGLSNNEAAFQISSRIFDILDILGLPETLEEIGVKEDEIDSMVENLLTKQTRFVSKNPRKAIKEDLMQLYRRMFEGL